MEKHINLSNEAEIILKKIQKEHNISSINKTIEFILLDYENNRNISQIVSTKVSEDLYKVLTRIRISTNATDINSQVMLEMLNSIVYQFNVKPMTTEFSETTTLSVCRKYVKDKIATFKQRKDWKHHE
ncbi:MAG: hypothetical protein ACI4F4_00490 [Lachnospiraceae bacterium]